MKVIAVTGGIACGKTTLVSALKKRGALIIDADAISRALTEAGGQALPEIRATFGEAVFTKEGGLNRKALADVIFSDPKKREKLNGIIHPLVEKEMRRQLRKAEAGGEKIVILDVPLLYEARMDKLADEVWCARLQKEEQIARLMGRDGLTRQEALARIGSQMPLEEKAKRANQVIDTSGSIENSAAIVTALYEDRLKEL